MEEEQINNPQHHEHNEHHEPVVHTTEHKNKNNKKWIYIGLGVLIVAAIILLVIAFSGNKIVEVEKYDVDYILSLTNGSNILTGKATVTQDSLSSTLGINSEKINSELTQMNVGEEKTITLSPVDAFGEYDSSKNISSDRINKMERKTTIDRIIDVSLSDFTDVFDEQPIVGKTYKLSSAPWDYKVLSKTEDEVKLSIETNVGKTIPNSIFSSKVVSINDTSIVLEMEGNNTVIPSENGNYEVTFDSEYVYFKLTPTIGQTITLGTITGRVIGMTNDKIFIDANPEYAGQEIILKLKLENKFKEKISYSGSGHIAGAPTMQVFIMSHCPYGTQMVKGVLPVMEKLKGKANIEIRFVGYTMHGAQEELDNNRMICIREEQNAKLIDYLECFVSNTGSEADSKKCISQVGIDNNKLESCLSSRVSGYMDVDKELNTKYGVQGSPTVVIDGEEANIYPRDAQSVANALCAAFTSNKPSECSFSFSTANPSPGFGTGSSTSSGGSCG